MISQHPYCRSCGSKVQSKNVCHHCGCEPMKGNNYCCDCGTTTIAQAIMCVECGASFQRKFPAVLAILIGVALVITLAGAGYFIAQNNLESSEKISDNITTDRIIDTKDDNKKITQANNELKNVIVNKIPEKLLKKENDALALIAQNIVPNNFKSAPSKTKPKEFDNGKAETIRIPVEGNKNVTPSRQISMNSFSSREINSYSAGCTYFEGRAQKNVIFFTTNVYGYIKINRKVYALPGVQKGNDVARFAGAGYEVIIEIEGLAGNENAWYAVGTMVIKDVRQKILSNHKIYSTCTDF